MSQKELAYTPNTTTACFLVEGARLYVYSPFEDAVTVEDLRTGQELLRKDKALGRAVEYRQLLGAARGRVILDVYFADAPQTEQMLRVDCATAGTQAFAQQGGEQSRRTHLSHRAPFPVRGGICGRVPVPDGCAGG